MKDSEIQKLVEVLQKLLGRSVFKGKVDFNVDARMMTNYFDVHSGKRKNKLVVNIWFDVDTAKMFTGSNQYDKDYAKVVYNAQDNVDRIMDHFGLDNKVITNFSFDYVNNDIFDDEVNDLKSDVMDIIENTEELTEDQKEFLKDNFFVNVYAREDDSPYWTLEAGGNFPYSSELELSDFESIVYEAASKYPLLNEMIEWNHYEISFWWD